MHSDASSWIPRGHSGRAAGHASLPAVAVPHSDQYFKRDDVGIIYQMNVAPAKQRGLIGATLLQAVFDRAAYGCRLSAAGAQ